MIVKQFVDYANYLCLTYYFGRRRKAVRIATKGSSSKGYTSLIRKVGAIRVLKKLRSKRKVGAIRALKKLRSGDVRKRND